jgi:hypothetical protein
MEALRHNIGLPILVAKGKGRAPSILTRTGLLLMHAILTEESMAQMLAMVRSSLAHANAKSG